MVQKSNKNQYKFWSKNFCHTAEIDGENFCHAHQLNQSNTAPQTTASIRWSVPRMCLRPQPSLREFHTHFCRLLRISATGFSGPWCRVVFVADHISTQACTNTPNILHGAPSKPWPVKNTIGIFSSSSSSFEIFYQILCSGQRCRVGYR